MKYFKRKKSSKIKENNDKFIYLLEKINIIEKEVRRTNSNFANHLKDSMKKRKS